MELKKYLLINSLFSFICGLSMLILNDQLNTFFHISNPLIFNIIGLNLIFFSFIVIFTAISKPLKTLLIKIIIILDILWVIGSLIIVVFQLFELSGNGYFAIGLVGIFIAFLAYQQNRNLQLVI